MIRKSMVACVAAAFVLAGLFAVQADEDIDVKETYKLGSVVDPFALLSTNGENHSLEGALGEKVVILYFWNYKCPYIVDYEEHLAGIYNEYKDNGDVLIWVIDSNFDNSNPEINAYLEVNERPYFVLRDEGNEIADRFSAERTPEVFVIGKDRKIHYHGAVADNPRYSEANTFYMKDAIVALLNGEEPATKESRPFGSLILRVPSL